MDISIVKAFVCGTTGEGHAVPTAEITRTKKSKLCHRPELRSPQQKKRLRKLLVEEKLEEGRSDIKIHETEIG
jgi:hypothetical protein